MANSRSSGSRRGIPGVASSEEDDDNNELTQTVNTPQSAVILEKNQASGMNARPGDRVNPEDLIKPALTTLSGQPAPDRYQPAGSFVPPGGTPAPEARPREFVAALAPGQKPLGQRELQQETQNQLLDERRREIDQRRAVVAQKKQETNQFNSEQLAQFKGSGQQYYTDPATGRVTPVLEPGTKRPLYHATGWTAGTDPKTGRATLQMRDKYGQNQYKMGPLNHSPDPHDTNLYMSDGAGGSVPAMTAEEAIAHPDMKIKTQGYMVQRRAIVAQHREALAPMKEIADQAAAAYDNAKTQATDIDAQIQDLSAQTANMADTAMIDGINSRVFQLQQQKDAIDKSIKPNGDLARNSAKAKRELRIAQHTASREVYAQQGEAIRAMSAAQGLPPEKNPTYLANQKMLEAVDRSLSEEQRLGAREDAIFGNAAQPVQNPAQTQSETATPTGPNPSDPLSQNEPYALAARGVKSIGGKSVEQLAKQYGTGQGPNTPDSLVALDQRRKDLEETLSPENSPPGKVSDALLKSMTEEKDYVDALYRQRFAKLTPEDRQKVTNAIERKTTTAGGAAARSAAENVGPTAAFLGGAELGSKLLAGTAGPTRGIGPAVGGVITGTLFAMLANKAQNKALQKFAPDLHEKLALDAEQHPVAAEAGTLASNAALMKVAPGTAVRGVSALWKLATSKPVSQLEQLAAHTFLIQSGLGGALGYVLPKVNGEKPTSSGVLQSIANALFFGEGRIGHGGKAPKAGEPGSAPKTPDQQAAEAEFQRKLAEDNAQPSAEASREALIAAQPDLTKTPVPREGPPKSAEESAEAFEPALAERANTPPPNKSAEESFKAIDSAAEENVNKAAAAEAHEAAYKQSPHTVDPERRSNELRSQLDQVNADWQKHLDQTAAEAERHAAEQPSKELFESDQAAARARHEDITGRRAAIEQQLAEHDNLRQSAAGGAKLKEDLAQQERDNPPPEAPPQPAPKEPTPPEPAPEAKTSFENKPMTAERAASISSSEFFQHYDNKNKAGIEGGLTDDAIAIGKAATPEQAETFKAKAEQLNKESHAAGDKDDWNNAAELGAHAQFFREAYETAAEVGSQRNAKSASGTSSAPTTGTPTTPADQRSAGTATETVGSQAKTPVEPAPAVSKENTVSRKQVMNQRRVVKDMQKRVSAIAEKYPDKAGQLQKRLESEQTKLADMESRRGTGSTPRVGYGPDGESDLLSDVADLVGTIKTAGRGGESDGIGAALSEGAARLLRSESGTAPDKAVAILNENGYKFKTVDEFKDALRAAASARKNVGAQMKTERYQQGVEMAALGGPREGKYASSKGEPVEQLGVGAKFKIKGENFSVVDVEEGADGRFHYIIQDGHKFKVAEGTIIHPDYRSVKNRVPKEASTDLASTDFLPEGETVEPAKPAEKFGLESATVDQQAKEAEAAREKAKADLQREKIAEKAEKPLTGDSSNVGQGQLLAGDEDLFNGPSAETLGKVKDAAPVGADVKKSTPASVEGDKIGKGDWLAFSDKSGSLKVPRAEMPQVKSEHRGALVNFLKARGIGAKAMLVNPSELKPTQAEFSPGKVEKARSFEGSDRPILISADGHVVDGHHQWVAALDEKQPIPVIRLDAPVDTILADMKEFPSVENAKGATATAPKEPRTSDKIIAALQAAKIHKPGVVAAGSPLSIAHDAALDLAILGIRAGRAVGDVIKLAVQRFKVKYPDATDEDVGKLTAAIEDAHSGMTAPERVAESANKTTSTLATAWKNARSKSELNQAISATRDAVETKAGNTAREVRNSVNDLLTRSLKDKNDLAGAQEALTFFREAGGSAEQLKAARAKIAASTKANDKWKARALKAIDYALKNPDQLKAASERYGDFTDKQVYREQGAGLPTLRHENYVMHAQDIEDGGWLDTGSKGPPSGSSTRKNRTYATLADSISAGIDPKTVNAIDLLESRIRAGESGVNARAWNESLKEYTDPATKQQIVRTPARETERADGSVYADPPKGYDRALLGNEQVDVKKEYSGIISAMTSPSWFSTNKVRLAAQKVNALGKSISLAVDTFHLGRLAFRSAMVNAAGSNPKLGSSYREGLTLLEHSPSEIKRMGEDGTIPKQDVAGFLEKKQTLEKLVNEGLNTGRVADAMHQELIQKVPIVGDINKFIFQKFQRGAMADAAILEYGRQKASYPELGERALAAKVAKEVNTRFGNLGRQGIFKSKTAQDMARMIWLAPQWNEGLIRSELGGVGQIAKSAVDAATGRRLAMGLLGRELLTTGVSLFAASQIINQVTRGKFTWENPEEGFGAKISAWIPDKVGGSSGFFLNPMGLTAETAHLLLNSYEKTGSNWKPFLNYFRSRSSTAARPIWTMATGKDELGKNIRDEDRVKESLKSAIPAPISGGSIARVGKGIAETMQGKSGKTEQFPGEFQKQAMQSFGLRTDNAPDPEQRIRKLAKEFNEKHGAKEKLGEFYPGVYDELNDALRRQNPDDIKDSLKTILEKTPTADVERYYKRYQNTSFAGSSQAEASFMRTLNPEQLSQYRKARANRTQIAVRALQALRSMPLVRKQPVGNN